MPVNEALDTVKPAILICRPPCVQYLIVCVKSDHRHPFVVIHPNFVPLLPGVGNLRLAPKDGFHFTTGHSFFNPIKVRLRHAGTWQQRKHGQQNTEARCEDDNRNEEALSHAATCTPCPYCTQEPPEKTLRQSRKRKRRLSLSPSLTLPALILI